MEPSAGCAEKASQRDKQSALTLAFLQGGETGFNQARAQILTQVRGTLTKRLQQSVAAVGDFLAIPEPAGLLFRIVLTTALTLKVEKLLEGKALPRPFCLCFRLRPVK